MCVTSHAQRVASGLLAPVMILDALKKNVTNRQRDKAPDLAKSAAILRAAS